MPASALPQAAGTAVNATSSASGATRSSPCCRAATVGRSDRFTPCAWNWTQVRDTAHTHAVLWPEFTAARETRPDVASCTNAGQMAVIALNPRVLDLCAGTQGRPDGTSRQLGTALPGASQVLVAQPGRRSTRVGGGWRTSSARCRCNSSVARRVQVVCRARRRHASERQHAYTHAMHMRIAHVRIRTSAPWYPRSGMRCWGSCRRTRLI